MTTLNLDTCADEPIHIPGSIQPHGTLIACRFDDRVVTQVAANCFELTGVTPEAALGFDAAAFFVPGELDRVLSVLRQGSVRETGPFHMVSASGVPLEVVAHESRGALVLELERRAEPSTTTFDPRLHRAIPQLQRAKTKGELMQLAADQVRRITGFDRVMIYRFDPEWNGHVAAESKRDDLDPFLGLHYPASDIPAQARRLYAQNWLRHIADVDYRPVQLTPTMDPTTGEPLDLSYAHLRSVSPIHVEYLRNMGVRASMSVSLIADGELIGLIACHHYAGPRLLSRSERETAEYIGQALSWNLHVFERADLAERARHVQSCEAELATSLAAHEDLLEGLATPALLSLTGASGVSVVLDEGVRSLGKTPEDQRVREIVAWLREQPNDVIATDHFATHYPAATHWDGVAAGLLATAISRELGEYIVWFRPSIERTIDWAGDPRKQAADPRDGQPARLSPRGSFALWREQIHGRSTPWERFHVDAASNLRRLLVGGARRRAATLRALNQRLVEMARAKDLFIATVSHELRTPLNAITGWAHLYMSNTLPAHRRDDAMRVVSRNAAALTGLVDDLLDVSRIVSGNVPLDVQAVDLGGIVESVADTLAPAAEAKGLRIERALGAGDASVLGDRARLRQIVTNLLSNAIKFTPKLGSIAIELTRRGAELEISVRDSGRGIDPAVLPRVFDAFWQADPSASRTAQGLGLGLAIAKKLVELHRGRIHAESDGEGRGATFRVLLPLASAGGRWSGDASASPRRTESRPLDGRTVVIVEDDPDARELLTLIVTEAGAVARVFDGGASALAWLRADACDVVVTDIGMPEMDGFALLAAVRSEDGPNRATPVVALTAYARTADRTSTLHAGFQAHLPKPVEPGQLVATLAGLATQGRGGELASPRAAPHGN